MQKLIFHGKKQTKLESASMVVVKREYLILFHAHLLLEFPFAGSKPPHSRYFQN